MSNAVRAVGRALVRANLNYDAARSEEARRDARNAVPLQLRQVKRGATLFRAGDTITAVAPHSARSTAGQRVDHHPPTGRRPRWSETMEQEDAEEKLRKFTGREVGEDDYEERQEAFSRARAMVGLGEEERLEMFWEELDRKTKDKKSKTKVIKNAKKSSSSPPTPGSPIFKRGQRAARRSQVPDMDLSESQVRTLKLKTVMHAG